MSLGRVLAAKGALCGVLGKTVAVSDNDVLNLTGTTVGAQTITIHRITPTGGALTIYWGDGNSTVVPNGSTSSYAHAYAGAGTWDIVATPASIITQIDLHDAKLSGFDSAQLSANAMTYFIMYSLGSAVANTVNSADMAGWTGLTHWYLLSMPAGGTYTINSSNMAGWTSLNIFNIYSMPAGTYTINSADMAGWTSLTNWRINSMPAGTYTINSANMAGWTSLLDWRFYSMPAGTYTVNSANMAGWTSLTNWYCFSMPAGTYTINSTNMAGWTSLKYWYFYSMPAGTYTITAADLSGWTVLIIGYAPSNSFNQATVDAILRGMYLAFPLRAATGGTIDVGGTNAAPSGIYQAMCPPTTGKEAAYELLNDSCGVSPNHWTTVTFTP